MRNREFLGAAVMAGLASLAIGCDAVVDSSEIGESESDIGESASDIGESASDIGESESDIGESESDIGESEAAISIRKDTCEWHDIHGQNLLFADAWFTESGSVRQYTKLVYHLECGGNWCRQTNNKNNVNFIVTDDTHRYAYLSPDDRVYGVVYTIDLDGWTTTVGGSTDHGWWRAIFDLSGLPDENCTTEWTLP